MNKKTIQSKSKYDPITGEPLLLNIERYREHLQNFANPDKPEGELYKTYFAALFNNASPVQYSKWINQQADEIRESNGERHLGQNKRNAILKYFHECNVDIRWLFTWGTEEEFFKRIDLRNYEVDNSKRFKKL